MQAERKKKNTVDYSSVFWNIEKKKFPAYLLKLCDHCGGDLYYDIDTYACIQCGREKKDWKKFFKI
ncbi:MAG: hypothetical protein ACE5H1_04610 [Thermodesulfobacteriota bacterium]